MPQPLENSVAGSRLRSPSPTKNRHASPGCPDASTLLRSRAATVLRRGGAGSGRATSVRPRSARDVRRVGRTRRECGPRHDGQIGAGDRAPASFAPRRGRARTRPEPRAFGRSSCRPRTWCRSAPRGRRGLRRSYRAALRSGSRPSSSERAARASRRSGRPGADMASARARSSPGRLSARDPDRPESSGIASTRAPFALAQATIRARWAASETPSVPCSAVDTRT